MRAGTLLIGQGCCRFEDAGGVSRIDTDGEKTWPVLGPPPPGKGKVWLGPALASPDQRWAVAQTYVEEEKKLALWLFRLSPPP